MNTENAPTTTNSHGTKKSRKRFGYIVAGPADYAIHRRGGRTLHAGRGISFINLPFLDRYYLVPSTAQSVSFAADQITAENQGVEVAGFAVWKITEPEKAASSFDFDDSVKALDTIGDNIRNVVESAIRHQVANMTIEDVLRKRGTIILQLKNELAYIAGQWGLEIETVEIKTVHVQSAHLFAQMQAKFRDAIRLESETSALDTEKLLGERRFAQQEELALKEQEFLRREQERSNETERLKIEAESKLKAFKLDQQRELVANDKSLHEERAALETSQAEHKAALATIEDETRRKQIETANTENHALAIVKQLPAAFGALKLTELHLGDNPLNALASYFSHITTRKDTK